MNEKNPRYESSIHDIQTINKITRLGFVSTVVAVQLISCNLQIKFYCLQILLQNS